MKYIVIVRKPKPFLEDWSWDVKENGGFCEKHDGFERGSIREDNEQSQKFEGKLETNFKNCP